MKNFKLLILCMSLIFLFSCSNQNQSSTLKKKIGNNLTTEINKNLSNPPSGITLGTVVKKYRNLHPDKTANLEEIKIFCKKQNIDFDISDYKKLIFSPLGKNKFKVEFDMTTQNGNEKKESSGSYTFTYNDDK